MFFQSAVPSLGIARVIQKQNPLHEPRDFFYMVQNTNDLSGLLMICLSTVETKTAFSALATNRNPLTTLKVSYGRGTGIVLATGVIFSDCVSSMVA